MTRILRLTFALPAVVLALLQFAFGQPQILSFSPASGRIGKTVTIIGKNFSTTPSNNIVYFGAVTAPVQTASAETLTVTVPAQATYRPITVTTGGYTGYSKTPFILTFSVIDTIATASFAAPQNLAHATPPEATVIADLDRDGKPDLATICYTGHTLSILPNTTSAPGTITFGTRIDTLTLGAANEIAVGDFDGDGLLDIAVSDFDSNKVSVYRNISTPGHIQFATRLDVPVGHSPAGIAVADLNGDGKPDIVVANETDGTVSVLQNTSTGVLISFTVQTLTPGGVPHGVAIADLDGDGLPEIAVANTGAKEVEIYRNISSGSGVGFDPTPTSLIFHPDSTRAPLFIAAGDIDLDGKIDLVVSDTTTSVFVARNTTGTLGVYTFDTPVQLFKGVGFGAVSLADMDGDGRPDILVGNSLDNTISIFKNLTSPGTINGSTFGTRVDVGAGSYSTRVVAGDLDGDGHPDLVVANFQSTFVTVLRNLLPDGFVQANVKVFLEGPYDGPNDTMFTYLNQGGILAAHFVGKAIPSRAVDSIAIELRNNSTSSPAYKRFAPAWLLSDGTIRSFADTTLAYVGIDSVNSGSSNYIVVHHRNHLAIMSSASVVTTSALSPAAYDFSGQQSKAFGVNAMVATGSRYSMIGGDADGSGVITIFDRALWRVQNSYSGYLNGDMNLDGIVTIFDRALWRVNNSLLSQVP